MRLNPDLLSGKRDMVLWETKRRLAGSMVKK
jgi:hypothetical protein